MGVNFTMFRKVLKILFVLSVMWLVSLFTIERQLKLNIRKYYTDNQLYDEALDRLSKKMENTDIQILAFKVRVWRRYPNLNNSLTSEEQRAIIKGYDNRPGMDGRPVELQSDLRYYIKQEIHKGWKNHAFNQFISDLIPINRTLLDPREDWCKEQNYSSDLPSISVVICFYNEAWSTLIRTVTSVITRTPPHLLDKLILVDDFSNMSHLKRSLGDYVRTTRKVILLRTPRREGLIRARMLGTNEVKSPVVVYLDSHCECAEGWIEPLLQRIKEDPTRIVSPVIDSIHDSTFEYIVQDDLQIGGFTWELEFNWISLSTAALHKRKNTADPVRTPTISGGLFAINKQFFKKLGYYDEGFDIWGAENLELSFKAWMCGGSMEIVPCSHVGHVFKKRIPYKEDASFLRRNQMRLAEVWLDEYAKYYYERIGKDKGDFGNVSHRKELRTKLKCKSFKWYLENVYPQLEIPDNYVASGQIYSMSEYSFCIDATTWFENKDETINLAPCHFRGGNQYWSYSSRGEIFRDSMCLDYMMRTLTIFFCRRTDSQVWIYNDKERYIKHMKTQKCLTLANFPDGYKLALSKCTDSSIQKWMMENLRMERLSPVLLYN